MMIKQRLLDICEALNISANQFSIDIGMSRSYIANLKKDITTEVLLNIYVKYPSVNIMRIITGEGDILLSKQNLQIDNSFFLEKYNQLEIENKKLLLEVGELKGELKTIKKHVFGIWPNTYYNNAFLDLRLVIELNFFFFKKSS